MVPTAPALADAPQRLQRLAARPRALGEASFFYFDTRWGREAVKVLPGEYFVHDEDVLITTTLGSCIAACLWDPARRIGGMNHFMLPDGAGSGSDAGRYGSYAMELLINALVRRGATRDALQAKVFGGGAVVSGMRSLNVGERNTDFVMDYLRTERIAVLASDVLGVNARKICFLPASGQVRVKQLSTAPPDALLQRERAAAHRAQPVAAEGGSIDLF